MAGSSCAVGHEQALGRRDAHAQHRRRVEIGEEDQDVVLLVVPLEIVDAAPGDHGPCCFSHSISSCGVCALLKIQSEYWLNCVDVAGLRSSAKRRTVTPRTRSAPSGYSFCHVM